MAKGRSRGRSRSRSGSRKRAGSGGSRGADRQRRRGLLPFLMDRLGLDPTLPSKAFPEGRYGSFLLGEVTLASLLVLGVTGIYLGLAYRPGVQPVTYQGAVAAYNGTKVPAAYASVLRISYDQPLGMLMRQAHHWAAYLFLAAATLHLLRVLFAGAYRNPRELGWVLGACMLLLGLLEGFTGYALPYDQLGALATTVGVAMLQAVPVAGTFLVNLVFGGAFPSGADAVLPRLFLMHVLLLPLALVALLALHLLVVFRHRHTQEPRRHPDEVGPGAENVVGWPLLPDHALVVVVVGLLTAAAIVFLAGVFPVQDILATGPADPTTAPTSVAPDWYVAWLLGALNLLPPNLGTTAMFLLGDGLPLLFLVVLVAWPLLVREDARSHLVLEPLARPGAAAAGVGGLSLVLVLTLAGMNRTVASLLGSTPAGVNGLLLLLTLVVPPLLAGITYAVARDAPASRR